MLPPFLQDVVIPLQRSFIQGRSTKDNVMVLQEVVHHIQKSKKKHRGLILKLDLKKSYDRVDWDFFEADTEALWIS